MTSENSSNIEEILSTEVDETETSGEVGALKKKSIVHTHFSDKGDKLECNLCRYFIICNHSVLH